jgi:predicted SAM-dependent methyltransferase
MYFMDALDELDIARAMDSASVSTLTRAQRRVLRMETESAGFDVDAYYKEEERRRQRQSEWLIESSRWQRSCTLRSHRTVQGVRVDCEVKTCSACGKRLWEGDRVEDRVLATESTLRHIYTCWECA